MRRLPSKATCAPSGLGCAPKREAAGPLPTYAAVGVSVSLLSADALGEWTRTRRCRGLLERRQRAPSNAHLHDEEGRWRLRTAPETATGQGAPAVDQEDLRWVDSAVLETAALPTELRGLGGSVAP